MSDNEDGKVKISQEFHAEVRWAIEKSITNLLGQQAFNLLYGFLKRRHDISMEEIPYHVEPLFETLEATLGFEGSRTISRMIAKEVYGKMGLKFVEMPELRLTDYLNEAKRQLTLDR